MKLLVVISLTITLSHVAVVHSARVRRQEVRPMQMSATDKAYCLKYHNVLRAEAGAADMELLTWNDSLAKTAKVFVESCKWGFHSRPPVPDTNFTAYGQNIATVEGPQINVVDTIKAWHDGKQYYDYLTLGCTINAQCGHYTQLVWSSTKQLGCHYHYCNKKQPLLSNTMYFSCVYTPWGNWEKQKPYAKGRACSKCATGAGWCKDKLCNSQCSRATKDCRCAAVCHNCGTLDSRTCRCRCADGWFGIDCSVPCKDTHKWCNAGWYPRHCNFDENIPVTCPVMCNVCKPNPDARVDQCEPVLGPAALKMSATCKMVQQLMMIIVVIIALSFSSNAAL